MIHNEDNFNAHPPAGFDGVFHWDVFKDEGCWGNTKIEPMDFDAVVERKLHYLVFETKDKGKAESQGQTWTLDRLRNAKSFTIVRIWPKSPPFEHMEVTYRNGEKHEVKGHKQIVDKIGAWYKWADSDPDTSKVRCGTCGSTTEVVFANGEWQCDTCYLANKGWNAAKVGKQ